MKVGYRREIATGQSFIEEEAVESIAGSPALVSCIVATVVPDRAGWRSGQRIYRDALRFSIGALTAGWTRRGSPQRL